MRLPTPLLRNNPRSYKNQFGHLLILAGSRRMLGAAALSALAAMRSGAGLVTIGIPKSLNETLQKKISPVIMTWPLPETPEQTIRESAFLEIKKHFNKYQAVALGPGLSNNASTQRFILKMIENAEQPLLIDADAISALSQKLNTLLKNKNSKVLTPHPGEMASLTGMDKAFIEKNRNRVSQDFAEQFRCILLLKGSRTIVTNPDKEIYINKTGNPGMATAGSGDVLTGIIAAFLAQGIPAFDAACWAAYVHGVAGDLAAKQKTKVALIATDLIDHLPNAFKHVRTKKSLS